MDAVWRAFQRSVAADGSLSRAELEGTLVRLGVSKPSVDVLLASVPTTPDGRFDFSEFLKALDDVPQQGYDLLVLGCGPAGVTAALEAASRGKHVAVLEPLRKPTGAPTGAYSKCIREAVMDKKWTWPEIHEMVQQITFTANQNTMRLLRVFQIEVLQGSASFVDEQRVKLRKPDGSEQLLHCAAVVIATGSRANRLPMIDFELPGVFDSDTISQLDFIPKSMIVQGGGIIGLEYANMFAKLGAKVIVVEFMENILQMLDCDLKAALLSDLASNKVQIMLQTGIKSVKPLSGVRGKPLLLVETSCGEFKCEALLSAVGRCGSTDGLELENVGIKPGRGKMIQVDENQYTGVGQIYAVGDVAGGNLATIGQAQAVRAVRKMFGSGQYTLQDKAVKPFTVWTIPEIAWAGVNQQEAEAQGLHFGVVQADYGKTVRGIVTGESGFLKLIFDKDNGKVLGVHICGAQASELINFGADAVNNGTTIFDILQFVFPAVTFHTLYGWAAAEAKIKFSGVKSLSGGAGWSRLRRTIIRHLERSDSELTFEEAVVQAFLSFDTDSSGFLDNQQLKDAMKSLGVDMDDEAIQEMMNEADSSADGVVDYGEFLAACKVHGSDSNPKALTRGTTGTLNLRAPSKASKIFDVVVLGCGPAGLKAALEAAGRGLRVALLEPKEQLTAAPTGAHSKCMRESVMEGKVTWPEIRTLIERVCSDAEQNAARLLRTFHVSVLRGSGCFVDQSTIKFTEESGRSEVLRTTGCVVATGSRANRLPMVPTELPGVFDSDSLAEIDYIPKKMVIQGGGIIGLEYANIFAKMGAKVLVVEFMDKVLQMVDCDLQAALLRELAANKVDLMLKTAIKSIKRGEGATRGHPVLLVELEGHSSPYVCDCFLSATGRCGQVEGLNLEAVGVQLGRGQMIQVDENQHTGVGQIYAVGDCAGGNLATLGQAQAVRAVRKMFGSGQYTLKDKEAKPYIVWTIPEVAWVGLNEQEASTKKLDFGVARVEYHRAVRGIVSGEEGFLKMIYDRPKGRILGVHVCGVQAGELINFGADAINNGTTIFDMLQFVFPAVTYHVLYNLAAAEAKLRMAGIKDVGAAASWARVKTAIQKTVEGMASTFEEAVKARMKRFDARGKLRLYPEELKALMQSLGLQFSEEQLEAMTKEADLQQRGFVDYPDFVAVCTTCTMGSLKKT